MEMLAPPRPCDPAGSILYHRAPTFVNRQIAQTFKLADPKILCILPIAIGGIVWYTLITVKEAEML